MNPLLVGFVSIVLIIAIWWMNTSCTHNVKLVPNQKQYITVNNVYGLETTYPIDNNPTIIPLIPSEHIIVDEENNTITLRVFNIVEIPIGYMGMIIVDVDRSPYYKAKLSQRNTSVLLSGVYKSHRLTFNIDRPDLLEKVSNSEQHIDWIYLSIYNYCIPEK